MMKGLPKDHKTRRVVWNYIGDIQIAAFAAGPLPVVLLQAPVTSVSKLTLKTARELAWALMSAAEVAETLAASSKGASVVESD